MPTYDEAVAAATAPGSRFETARLVIDGVEQTVFVHAPRSLRELFDSLRAKGDAVFLVYEDERWTFERFMAEVDAVAAALVADLGVRPGDRVGVAMRNLPEWVVGFA